MGSSSSYLSCNICYCNLLCTACRCISWKCSRNIKTIDKTFKFKYLDYFDVDMIFRVYENCWSVEETQIFDKYTNANFDYIVHDLEKNAYIIFTNNTKPVFIVRP